MKKFLYSRFHLLFGCLLILLFWQQFIYDELARLQTEAEEDKRLLQSKLSRTERKLVASTPSYTSVINFTSYLKSFEKRTDTSFPIACMQFHGRLGNIMLEYAYLYILAKKKDLFPIIPRKFELTKIFNIPDTTHLSMKRQRECKYLPLYKERWACSYDENMTKVPDRKSLRLLGFFQSWKYWIKHEEEIRTLFRFKNVVYDKATRIFEYIKKKLKFISYSEDIIVGIHARRGDYILKPDIEFGKLTPNETYYVKAMSFFRNKFSQNRVLFVAASNDIKWLKKALRTQTNVYVTEQNSPALDMAILSMANHTIMSVGTYGWWIGWMTGGITVFSKRIFVPGSGFAKDFRNEDIQDFIYPGWIGME